MKPILTLGICLLVGVLLCTSSQAEIVRVFLLAGQSNANGSGTNASKLLADPVDADILFYHRNGAPPADGSDSISSGWTQLQAQTDHPGDGNFLNPNGGFGPEIGIGRRLAGIIQDRVAIIKVAYNGTYLYSDWNGASPAGHALYPVLVSEVNQAIQLLEQSGYEVWISGFFWMQGESDAKSRSTSSPPPPQPQTAQAYLSNLRSLIQKVRQDFESPNLPVVVGRIASVDTSSPPGNNFEYWDTIREAQVTFGEADVLGRWVDTDDLSKSDWLHYDSSGMLVLGERMADAWLQAAHKPSYVGTASFIEVETQAGLITFSVSLERPANISGMSYQLERSDDTFDWAPAFGSQSSVSAEPGWEVLTEQIVEPYIAGASSFFRWRLAID